MIINKELLDKVSAHAKESQRLRMNYYFHQSLDDKCHRMLNALEPGTDIPIHRHPERKNRLSYCEGRCVPPLTMMTVL